MLDIGLWAWRTSDDEGEDDDDDDEGEDDDDDDDDENEQGKRPLTPLASGAILWRTGRGGGETWGET